MRGAERGDAAAATDGEALLRLLEQGIMTDAEHGEPFAYRLGRMPSISRRSLVNLEGEKFLSAASKRRFPRLGQCILADEVLSSGDKDIDVALARIMQALPAAARAHGVGVGLNRYDLFHGHLFSRGARNGALGTLGILFHAAEYPRRDDTFPIELGFCQRGSTLTYMPERMRYRNLLLLLPRAHGGSDGGDRSPMVFMLNAAAPRVRQLIPEFAREPFQTLDEGALGEPLADVYMLPASGTASAAVAAPAAFGWVPRRSSCIIE